MTPDSILSDYRSFYNDAGTMANRFKELNKTIAFSSLSQSVVAEYNYLRGCFYFDFEAFCEARQYLKIALDGSNFMESWMILKIRELIITCDLWIEEESVDLKEFMSAYEVAGEEDKVLPNELRNAVGRVKDIRLRSLLDKWINEIFVSPGT